MPSEKREPKVGDRVKIACGNNDLVLKVVDVKEEKLGYWVYCDTAYQVAGIGSFAWDNVDILEADWQ